MRGSDGRGPDAGRESAPAGTGASVEFGLGYCRRLTVTGRKIAHYEILESLGAGGMGQVYRAHDTRLDRDVAIKLLPPGAGLNENTRRRFQREAMAASKLNHPNIITIYQIDTEEQTDFIAMEYVRGQTLHALLKGSRLSLRQVLRYAVQIAEAMAKAHGAGIIHRDLKPGNIMITDDGLVKVLDFGLAKFDLGLAGETHDRESETVKRDGPLSIAGAVSGTLAYMSPEQARGETVDSRSDTFSFGVVLFQMLSGELPFPGASQLAVLHNLHFNPPRDLASLRPEVPQPLAELVSRTLEKDPVKRVQSMSEVAAELRRIEREQEFSSSRDAVLPTVTSAKAAVTGDARRRNRWLLVGGSLILIFAAVFGLRELIAKHRLSAPGRAKSSPAEESLSSNPYALYKQARQDLDYFDREGSSDRAIQLLNRAVQLNPSSAASYAALAEACFRKNQSNPDPQWTKLASEYAGRAVALDGDLAASHVAVGLAEMQQGHSAEAEKQFRLAAELDPKSSVPHRWLGTLDDRMNRGGDAEGELQRAVQLDPTDWKNYMQLGLNRYLVADYRAAVENWQQALKLEPDNVDALRDLGAAYHALDRDDDAASAFQRALEIKATADAYNNLGTMRFYQGHYEDAKNDFEKTVALNANSYDSWGNLADAYRWTPGNQDKAKQAYEHAIELLREELAKNPDDPDMRATLATYLVKTGDKAAALRELEAVVKAKPREALTYFRMSVAYELCGDRNRALDALAASVKAGQGLNDVKNEPELVSLRADPRYHLQVLSLAKAGAPAK